ncbi:hypothetical protein [Rickettsia endosymbiont of Orchestes rusci]|uniref:hypothetical protein n=1 Tax=Rickettsia endosymbiont of Orchestes rusci TaxID=3066250 RepID=UPI00313B55D8
MSLNYLIMPCRLRIMVITSMVSYPLLYERLNKEVKILSFRGYDHGIQLIIS